MENALYANGILFKHLLIFDVTRKVCFGTDPTSFRAGEQHLTSESQSVEVFYDDWHLKKLHVEGMNLK